MHAYLSVLPLLISLAAMIPFVQHTVYSGKTGTVKFTSEAPLELIQAQSNKLSGVLDPNKKTFAFTVAMRSFEGFNSPLQREHFNENYVESDKFPQALFKGKIIEDLDLTTPGGTHHIRAKGILHIHGIEKERIINAKLTVKNNTLEIISEFEVPLKDHDIRIPKIVNQKIAEVIRVEVNIHMMMQVK